MRNNNEMSDSEIIEKANKAIIKELGVAGYMRYLRLRNIDNTNRDYVKEQENLFKNMSVEELSKAAKDHWDKTI